MTQNIYTFEDSMKVADKGTVEITSFFERMGYTVENVEDDLEYRKKDIDLLVTHPNGTLRTIEIKVDTYYPRNFYIEVISNLNKMTPGCFMYTESDYIMYYFRNHNQAYMIPTKKFQDWFTPKKDDFIKPKAPFTPAGSGGYSSEGRLVPVSTMAEALDMKSIKIRK